MTRTPMPSPNGTNHERAFLPAGSPVAAYDAAPDADVVKQLSDFLSDKITPEDWQTVKKMLTGEDADFSTEMAGDAARYYDRVREQYRKGQLSTREYESRMTSPPPRRSTPADAARFAEMFPNAGRLKQL